MSPVFVDTNVLLYTFDDAYPDKRDQAQAWVSACWLQRRGRVSTQVLNEFYANARKRFRHLITPGDARAEVRRYQEWSPWQIDHATVETAWAWACSPSPYASVAAIGPSTWAPASLTSIRLLRFWKS